MAPLNRSKIKKTENDVPESVAAFQDDVHGVGAICRAVRECISGTCKAAVFITAKHNGMEWEETGGFSFGVGYVDGKPCFRWNHGDDGSSSIVATWYDDCMDPARIVGTIVENHGGNVFRIE